MLTLAAQQAQQVNTFSANVQITATGATSANLFGTMNEVATTPTSPTISIMANAGQLGNVQIILSNGMAYMRSPFFMSAYHKRWIESSMSSMSSNSGLNLGPLLALLQGSSPLVQTQMFPFGSNMRYMRSAHFDGFRMREYGGHIMLASIMNRLSSSMQPMVQSWMNAGISMTRFPGLGGPVAHGAQAGADRGARQHHVHHHADHQLVQPADAHRDAAQHGGLHPAWHRAR